MHTHRADRSHVPSIATRQPGRVGTPYVPTRLSVTLCAMVSKAMGRHGYNEPMSHYRRAQQTGGTYFFTVKVTMSRSSPIAAKPFFAMTTFAWRCAMRYNGYANGVDFISTPGCYCPIICIASGRYPKALCPSRVRCGFLHAMEPHQTPRHATLRPAAVATGMANGIQANPSRIDVMATPVLGTRHSR